VNAHARRVFEIRNGRCGMSIEILQRHEDRNAEHQIPMARADAIDQGSNSSDSLRLLARAVAGECAQSIVAGDLVRVREGVWRVMEVRTCARGRSRALRLIGADALNRWQPCTLLEPFDRPRRVEAARAPRVVSRAQWMRTCAALIAASPPSECPATIADAQVTLMPHQIDPVLAVLRGRASRLLLADAVGLGKTIQAALLVRELRARGCADRVLILVPSGLREQWRQELSHRTGLRADIIDAAALAARMRDLPPDVNPWSLPGILIVSLDFIKQPSVLRGASTIVWDILIADEAHNLNEGTDRLAAADLLARHSRHVVLLTATPHHGSDDAFATLCRIGHLGDADADARTDSIAIFRRTRQTIGLARTRKVHVLRVTPTKQERRLHTLLARYIGRVERECGSDNSINSVRVAAEAVDDRSARSCPRPAATDAGASASTTASTTTSTTACAGEATSATHAHAASLAMSILLKRASSSAWSLERSLRRRLALLDSRALTATDDQPRTQPTLPFGDDGNNGGNSDDSDDSDEDVADGEPLHVLGTPGLRSARIERAWLTLLIEASRNASRAESKPRALARLLRRCREPALIYTEYRDTLTHLARTLPASSSHAMLHGGLGGEDRRAALARFASGEARILLTTDAAGEGLNLHNRCRLVINVELPWNPNRLEQRIGRVDRLGQTRTVHAIHLVGAGTAEAPMLTRLTGRIAQIAATLGDAPAVLRASREFASPEGDMTLDAEAMTAATPANADAVDGVHRSVSTAAADIVVQLQRVRAMRGRAWRIDRCHAGGTDASRGDPLLALDQRAPLIAVARRRQRRTRKHIEPDARRCGSTKPRLSCAHELPAPGLICIWRTRVQTDDGEAQSRARQPWQMLTVTHIACDVPDLRSNRSVAAFVLSMIERGRARMQPLLDSELSLARERLRAAQRARIERLARRDDAIATEMSAMLSARAAANGSFQPLLFDDIAIEKTTMTGVNDRWCRTRTYVVRDADADGDGEVDGNGDGEGGRDGKADGDAVDAHDAAQRVTSSPALVLVLR
jgi:superfamily II DNA or RNA helicase